MNSDPTNDVFWMDRALELARQGEGRVEPNPLVGCVLVRDQRVIGEGGHGEFGGPHAEIVALQDASQKGESPAGATAYVTLEPCSHTGKTGPCADALIAAGVARVVAGMEDPFPEVSGAGFARLRDAGISVTQGVREAACRSLNAPYLTRLHRNRPWILAKWAMTLDGKLATQTGDSQWISNESSREQVQQLRGRVDGIVVGIGTALADDPLLIARPRELTDRKRLATRIVLDSKLQLPLDSQLVQTADSAPVLVVAGPDVDSRAATRLEAAGCEVWRGTGQDLGDRFEELLKDLAKRGMTNLLVEGGGEVLGTLFDHGLADEIHLFVGTQVFGGSAALSPVKGRGFGRVADAPQFELIKGARLASDWYGIYRRRDAAY